MKRTIVFQGDSITDVGRSRDELYIYNTTNTSGFGRGYPNLVSAHLGFDYPEQYMCYNRGISGNRIVDLYARIKMDIINLKPDILSILIGVNDVWHEIGAHKNGVEADKFEKIYDMLITEIKQALPDIKILILEPFVLKGNATLPTDEIPDRWDIFNREVPLRAQAAKRIAIKHGLVFVPLQDKFDAAAQNCEMGYWLHDGVHPTLSGHELIKREWLKAFETYIK